MHLGGQKYSDHGSTERHETGDLTKGAESRKRREPDVRAQAGQSSQVEEHGGGRKVDWKEQPRREAGNRGCVGSRRLREDSVSRGRESDRRWVVRELTSGFGNVDIPVNLTKNHVDWIGWV